MLILPFDDLGGWQNLATLFVICLSLTISTGVSENATNRSGTLTLDDGGHYFFTFLSDDRNKTNASEFQHLKT